MKIRAENRNPVTFKAIHVADTYNNGKNLIKIYELTDKDKRFLNNLGRNINLQTLMPKMDIFELEVWQAIFDLSVRSKILGNNTGLAAFYKNKPCGIMTYTPQHSAYKLNCICTWPVQQEQRVPFAGSTLIAMLFNDFLKTEARYIYLDAVTSGPFNVVEKYRSLGFKKHGDEKGIVPMRALRAGIVEALQKLNQKIKIIPKFSENEVDLNNIN